MIAKGLGTFTPPNRPDYIDPGIPPDPAIVAHNNALSNSYDLGIAQAQANNNYDQCMQNAQNATSKQQYDDTVARCNGQFSQQSPAGGGGYTGTSGSPGNFPQQFSFTTNRGNVGTYYPGDTWKVSITGTPGSKVVTQGSMKGSSYPARSMGVTDSSGNWSLSGTFSKDDIGDWIEYWLLNGQIVSTLQFSIANPSATVVVPASSQQVTSVNSKPVNSINTTNTSLIDTISNDVSSMNSTTMMEIGGVILAGILLFSLTGRR